MAGCVGVLLASQTLVAADRLERLRADVPVTLDPQPAVKVTTHEVPAVLPDSGGGGQPRTLLELFSSWVDSDHAQSAESTAPVKVEPPPVPVMRDPAATQDEPPDGVVPIDPAPKVATVPAPGVTALDPADGALAGAPGTEPLGVLTTELVPISLVTASLWGKSPAADDKPGDELDRLAAASARDLDRPAVPASRRLVERAKPPLKSGRVDASRDAIDHLIPIEPAAPPVVN